jgi:hypothetical protein
VEDQNQHFGSSGSKTIRQRTGKNGLDFWGDDSIAEQKSAAAFLPAKSRALDDDLDFVGDDVLAEQKSGEAVVPAKSVGSSPGDDRHSGDDSNVDLQPASKMELYLHVLNATCQVCFFFPPIF